jgi:uncharacterized protein (TIRG00374 family)
VLAAGFVLAMLAVGVFSGGRDLLASLERIDLGFFLLLLGMAFASFCFRFLRWHLAARSLGIRVPVWRHMLFFLAGFSMTLTPGRVGEVLRLYLLRKSGGHRYEKTAPLLFIDRLSDVVAIAMIGAVAALAIGRYELVSAVVLAGALAANLVFFKPGWFILLVNAGYATLRRSPRLFARLRVALREMGRLSDHRIYGAVLALSLASWLTEGYAFHLLLARLAEGSAAAGLPAAAGVLVFSLATLAGVITMLPGGLGGAELSMLGMLIALGVPNAAAVAATAVIRVVTLWFAVVVGFIALPFALKQAERRD